MTNKEELCGLMSALTRLRIYCGDQVKELECFIDDDDKRRVVFTALNEAGDDWVFASFQMVEPIEPERFDPTPFLRLIQRAPELNEATLDPITGSAVGSVAANDN